MTMRDCNRKESVYQSESTKWSGRFNFLGGGRKNDKKGSQPCASKQEINQRLVPLALSLRVDIETDPEYCIICCPPLRDETDAKSCS